MTSVSPNSTTRPGLPLLGQEERAALRDPLRLLHVVRHDDDGHLGGDVADGLLDPVRRRRVEGRARLVHQQHPWAHRQGAGDAQALLLAAGERATELAEAVLHLVPQAGLGEHLLDQSPSSRRTRAWSGRTSSPDRTFSSMVMAGNGFGFWKTMPMWRRVSLPRRAPAVDVHPVELDPAGQLGARGRARACG